jgi:Na+/H+ antiporter NhaD/arsenite permease-like protein
MLAWALARPAMAQGTTGSQPAAGVLKQMISGHPESEAPHPVGGVPSLLAAVPFAVLLLSIAILPLIPGAAHWWHHNRNKLLVAGVLAAITLGYYLTRGVGIAYDGHGSPAGAATVKAVLRHAVLADYIPFIILLFSLYTISGGIQLRGDVQATPAVNTAFLATGAVLASFVGTTGASMLLIRALLQTNKERRHVRHTVIFFIFLVSNVGGCLLPIGDPPLFLGYLRGVPFLWTLRLVVEWAFCVGVLLVVYYLWDRRAYRTEAPVDRMLEETEIEPLHIRGTLNFAWLLGVVLAVALIVPGASFLGTGWAVPEHGFIRELVMLGIVGLAWVTTSPRIRQANQFDFGAIAEVAALFIGIFITMQAPLEILKLEGARLGLSQPWHFFWATGSLSSFLDNAPTYAVFFATAGTLPAAEGVRVIAGVPQPLLVAISLGSVFMGANTYIGNGPNFMVKSIAESSGVKMPSFFGYMAYSLGILIPVFVVVTVLFVR